MSSKRDLKKDINYVLGDIIEAVYIWEMTNPDKGTEASEKIIDQAIEVFDDLIQNSYNLGVSVGGAREAVDELASLTVDLMTEKLRYRQIWK